MYPLHLLTIWAKIHDIPDYVKTAEHDVLNNYDAINQYTSRENVWLAGLEEYYKNPSERNQHKLAEIHKYANFFNIRQDLNNLRDEFIKIDNTVDDPDNYVIFSKHAEDAVKWGPVRNQTEWEAAFDYLQRNEMTLPTQLRRKIAQKLLNKADDYIVNIKPEVESYLNKRAGLGVPIFEKIHDELKNRASKYSSTELNKLATLVDDMWIANQETYSFLDDIAETISTMDSAHYKTSNYKEIDVTAPDEFLYTLTHNQANKVASEFCTLKDGNIFTYDQLKNIPFDKLASVIGDDMASETMEGLNISPVKVAEIIETLPLPQAEMFTNIMNDLGETPAIKTAAVVENIWSEDYLKHTAADISYEK